MFDVQQQDTQLLTSNQYSASPIPTCVRDWEKLPLRFVSFCVFSPLKRTETIVLLSYYKYTRSTCKIVSLKTKLHKSLCVMQTPVNLQNSNNGFFFLFFFTDESNRLAFGSMTRCTFKEKICRKKNRHYIVKDLQAFLLA